MPAVMNPVRTGKVTQDKGSLGTGKRWRKNRKSEMKSVIFIALKKKSLFSIMFLYIAVFKFL